MLNGCRTDTTQYRVGEFNVSTCDGSVPSGLIERRFFNVGQAQLHVGTRLIYSAGDAAVSRAEESGLARAGGFVGAVAEHRGFSASAAVALEVSPSALSQAIRQLEARLGVRLLNRTTRSVSLTEAGQAYLLRIGPALADVLDAGEQLHALQGRPL